MPGVVWRCLLTSPARLMAAPPRSRVKRASGCCDTLGGTAASLLVRSRRARAPARTTLALLERLRASLSEELRSDPLSELSLLSRLFFLDLSLRSFFSFLCLRSFRSFLSLPILAGRVQAECAPLQIAGGRASNHHCITTQS